MLFVVATPIGNLGDITFRALEVLKSVDKIFCEDTRHSRILLNHYGITTPTESLHQHTSPSHLGYIVKALKNGQDFAYITDAGTPGIADPGGLLAQACFDNGIAVSPIPGASSVTALLSVAGLPANSYWFAGFVPTKKGRQTFLKKVIGFPDTVVLFVTAPRLLKFLNELKALDFTGQIIVGRELTKQFEEIKRGTLVETTDHFNLNQPRGEFVIVLRKS